MQTPLDIYRDRHPIYRTTREADIAEHAKLARHERVNAEPNEINETPTKHKLKWRSQFTYILAVISAMLSIYPILFLLMSGRI